jgi:hypothetical protein
VRNSRNIRQTLPSRTNRCQYKQLRGEPASLTAGDVIFIPAEIVQSGKNVGSSKVAEHCAPGVRQIALSMHWCSATRRFSDESESRLRADLAIASTPISTPMDATLISSC